MKDKKTKLTLSGIAKKSIQNIEIAKTQSKTSLLIKKKTTRFANKSSLNTSTSNKRFSQNTKFKEKSSFSTKPVFYKSINPITSDFEKRKLAEQRATKRLKGELLHKDVKGRVGSKKEN